MTNKNPILLTLTRYTATDMSLSTGKEEVVVVHPNQLEAFGQQFTQGKKGSIAIVRYNEKVWQLVRGNNTAFFKAYDKVRGNFWWPKRREGIYWFDDAGRVNAWSAMWA
jgi:hypothetical protein